MSEATWAKVTVDFYRHPRTRRMSKDAQHLYLASILHCKEFGTDGRFPADETPYLASVSRVRPSVADELFTLGAWIDHGDEYEVRDYLDYQTPAAVERARSIAGKKAADARWAKEREEAERNAAGNADRIANGNAEKSREEKRDTSRDRSALLAGFDDFWDVYPKRVARGAAEKAWPKAVKAAGDAEAIIAGAEAYAENMEAHRTAREFIAHPATWLNAKRWLDDLVPPSAEDRHPKQVIR